MLFDTPVGGAGHRTIDDIRMRALFHPGTRLRRDIRGDMTAWSSANREDGRRLLKAAVHDLHYSQNPWSLAQETKPRRVRRTEAFYGFDT